MVDKNKQLKVSFGIFVGYIIAALINVLFFEKDFAEAFADRRLIYLFVGILVSFWLINRRKKSN